MTVHNLPQAENGLSLRQACDAVGVHHSLLVHWRKQKSRLMHIPNPLLSRLILVRHQF